MWRIYLTHSENLNNFKIHINRNLLDFACIIGHICVKMNAEKKVRKRSAERSVSEIDNDNL